MDPIICIGGPTASGKTELSLRLAQALGAEIVSCDSMQIYKRMDIGTAKPTAEERARAVHHMIDLIEPNDDFSVGRYVQLADACVQDILRRQKPVIVVGGTGLYCDSLILGRDFAPIPSTGKREALEHRADTDGTAALHAELSAVDPDAAERIAPADRKRIIRALEVFYETGKTITAHNLETQKKPPRYSPLTLTLDYENRQELYDRIDLRVDLMREQGLEREVQSLLDEGIPRTCTAMQAIGYKELCMAFDGVISKDEAYALIQKRSRNYAKRQLTWFRRNEKAVPLLRTRTQSDDALFSLARQKLSEFAEIKW